MQKLQNLATNNDVNYEINISSNLINIFNKSEKISHQIRDTFISVDSFLLATINSNDIITKLLKQNNVLKNELEQIIKSIRQGEIVDSQNSKQNRGEP